MEVVYLWKLSISPASVGKASMLIFYLMRAKREPWFPRWTRGVQAAAAAASAADDASLSTAR